MQTDLNYKIARDTETGMVMCAGTHIFTLACTHVYMLISSFLSFLLLFVLFCFLFLFSSSDTWRALSATLHFESAFSDACKDINADLRTRTWQPALTLDQVCQPLLSSLSLYILHCKQINIEELSLRYTFQLPICGEAWAADFLGCAPVCCHIHILSSVWFWLTQSIVMTSGHWAVWFACLAIINTCMMESVFWSLPQF